MKTPIRIEVEPLSDQRWAKIERGLIGRFELEVPGRERLKGVDDQFADSPAGVVHRPDVHRNDDHVVGAGAGHSG